MSEIHTRDYQAPINERFATSNEEIKAEFAIDPHRDPYEIPLDQLDPSHPSLFESDTIFPYFERLRKEDPLHFCPGGMYGAHWSVTKYNDIVEMEKRYDLFSSEQRYGGIQIGGQPYDSDQPDPKFNLPMFIMMDPPKHGEQRGVVQPLFLQRPLQLLEPVIRERAAEILDGLPLNEEFDWVPNVSIDLTGRMLATLFDIPQEDRNLLIHWSDTVQNMSNPLAFKSVGLAFEELWKCHAYFSEVFEARKKEKQVGNDLISMLAHGEATRNMPPNELLGNLLLLIVGGNDTTRNSISGGVLFLNQFPEEYQKLLEDPNLIPNMVSEIVRFQSPTWRGPRRRTANFAESQSNKGTGSRCGTYPAIVTKTRFPTQMSFKLIARMLVSTWDLGLAFIDALATGWQRCNCAFYGKKSTSGLHRLRL